MLCICGSAAAAGPGELDQAFGSHGATLVPGIASPYGFGQSGNELVLAGGSDATGNGALAALTENGAIDSSFDSVTSSSDPFGSEGFNAMAVEPDGDLVVAAGNGLARYLPDGELDTTFGTGGYVDIGSMAVSPDALAVDADGNILVGGSAGFNFAVERYTTGGQPAGYAQQQIGGEYDAFGAVTSLAVQPNGEVVAVGYAGDADASDPSWTTVVARIESGGFDGSFGHGGLVLAQLGHGPSPSSQAQSVALEANGDIAVGGLASAGVGGGNAGFVELFDSAGKLVSSFGDSGVTTLPELSFYGSPVSLAAQSNDDLVLATSADVPSFGRKSPIALSWSGVTARILPGGALDPSYGKCGVTGIQLASANGVTRPLAVRIVPGGDIEIAGDADGFGSNRYDGFVARYVGGGKPASVPAGWSSGFGIPVPPPPQLPPDGVSISFSATKADAGLVETTMGWQSDFVYATQLALLAVPGAGEAEIILDAGDVVTTLVQQGAGDIATDPPAHNFKRPVKLRYFRAPLLHARGVGRRVIRAFDAYARQGALIASLERAYLQASEREEGALRAGNHKWAARQAAAARGFQARLAEALRLFPARSAALYRLIRHTREGRLKLTAAEIARARRKLDRRGLVAVVRRRLLALGLSRAQLAALLARQRRLAIPRRLSLQALMDSKPAATVFSGFGLDLGRDARCQPASTAG
jgi:uncharacterized delta-60 repeat protein